MRFVAWDFVSELFYFYLLINKSGLNKKNFLTQLFAC
jgi:hypothetical protein